MKCEIALLVAVLAGVCVPIALAEAPVVGGNAVIRAPEGPRNGSGPTYGRWNFKAERVVKWNCVFRLQNPDGLSGDFSYDIFVAVGSLEEVRTTLAALQKM